MQTVDLPDGRQATFEDGTSPEEMASQIRTQYPELAQPQRPTIAGPTTWQELADLPLAFPRAAALGLGMASKGIQAGIGRLTGSGDTTADVIRSVFPGKLTTEEERTLPVSEQLRRISLAPPKPLPVEQAIAKTPGAKGIAERAGFSIAGALPRVALLGATPEIAGGGGVAVGVNMLAKMIAAGGIFGMDDQGRFQPKQAVIASLFPPVMAGASRLVAEGLGRAIASGATALANPIAQKAIGQLGEQAAMDALTVAADTPELLELRKKDPAAFKKQLAEIIGGNLAWGILGIPDYRGKVPSPTEKFFIDHADKYADQADAAITRLAVGRKGQQAIADAIKQAAQRGRIPSMLRLQEEPGPHVPLPPEPPQVPPLPGGVEPLPSEIPQLTSLGERLQNAARNRRIQEHRRITLRPELPPQPPQVREGEGEQDRGSSGAIGSTPEQAQAPNVPVERPPGVKPGVPLGDVPQPLTPPATSGTLPAAAPATITAQEQGEKAPEMAAETGVSPLPTAANLPSAAELRKQIEKVNNDYRKAQARADKFTKIGESQSVARAQRQADRARQQLEILRGNLSVVEAEAPKKPVSIARGVAGVTRFNRDTEMNGPDILSWIHENMRLLSRSAAQKMHGKDWWRENKSDWDDAPAQLSSPHHNVIYDPRGSEPNRVAQAAFEANQISEPTSPALWEAIAKASKTRKGFSEDVKRVAEEQKNELARHDDWVASIQKEKGKIEVAADELKIGNKLEIGGERFDVTEIDPDSEDVILQDGRRFGKQRLSPNQTIYVEKFEEGGAAEAEFPAIEAPAAAPAKKPAGGELFAAEEIPFNLSGETARAPAAPPKPASPEEPGLFSPPAPPPEPESPPSPPSPPKIKERPLTPAEQREFHALTMKDRSAREAGGEKLTTEETKRYEYLTAIAGQQDFTFTEPTKPETPPTQAAAQVGAPEGTEVRGYRKIGNQWKKLDDQGNVRNLPPANKKVAAGLEADAGRPAPPPDTRAPHEILSQATQVRVKGPEGTTFIRITNERGQRSVENIGTVNGKVNPFHGVDIRKIEAGTGPREKFKPHPQNAEDVKVEDATRGKHLRAIGAAVEEGPRLTIQQAESHIQQTYGIAPGGKVKAVDSPDADWFGISRFSITKDSTRSADGSWQPVLTGIEINAPRIGSTDELDWVMEHEFAHAAADKVHLPMRVITQQEFTRIMDQVTKAGGEGYPANEIWDEFRARAVQRLADTWRGRNWFEQAVGTVLAWFNKIGFPVTRLSAERIATMEISRAIADARKAAPKGETLTPEKTFKALARTAEDIERRRVYEDTGWRAALVGGFYHVFEVQSRHADALNIYPEGRAMDKMNVHGDLTRIGLDESGRVNYYDARDNAASFGERQEVVLDAFESVVTYQRLGIRNRERLEKAQAEINSQQFRNRLERLSVADERREAHAQLRDRFLNQIVGAAGRITSQMERQRIIGSEAEALSDAQRRVQRLPDYASAVQQVTEDIVNRIAGTDEGIALLGGGGTPSGQDILNAYFAANPEAVHVGEDRFAAQQIAAAILATNRDLRNGLTSIAILSRDIGMLTEVNETGRRIATELINNPATALPRLTSRASNLSQSATRAQAIWMNLHRDVAKAIRLYEIAGDAVRLHEAVSNDPEWKQYVNTVMRDNGALVVSDNELRRLTAEQKAGGPRAIDAVFFKAAGNQVLYGPDGTKYQIDMGWTPDSVKTSQAELGKLSANIAGWLDNPDNNDSPSRGLWEQRHRLIQHVLMGAAVWNPSSIRMLLGKGAWGMPETYFQGLSLPSAKIAFLSFQNFSRWFNQAKGWFTDWKDPSRRAVQKAYATHGFNELEVAEYRQALFDQMAFRFRNGREVRVGDWINGQQVTREDMALMHSQGRMFSESYDRLRKTSEFAGVREVMEDPRIVEEFESGAWGVRMPQQRGITPNTTLPRDFSGHGRELAKAIHMIVGRRDEALGELPKLAVDMTEDQQSAARQQIQADFERTMMRYLNDPNRANYFVTGSFIQNRTSTIHRTISDYESAYRDISAMWDRNDPNKPITMEEIVDSLTQHWNAAEALAALEEDREPEVRTPERVQRDFLNEITAMTERFEKNFGSSEADFGKIMSDPNRKSAYTEATKGEIFPAYFYTFGAMDAGELRGRALDMGLFGFRRAMESLRALRADMQNSLAEMSAKTTAKPWREEQQRINKEAFRSGEDFRDFQRLQDKLLELDRFIKGLPVWAGEEMVRAEGFGLGSAQRLLNDTIQAALSGPRTLWRISGATLGGSTIKMGQVLYQSGFGRMRSYPAAALSAITSMLRFGTSAGIGWYDERGFTPGVPLQLLKNLPGAFRAAASAKGKERVLSFIENELRDITDEQYAALKYWHDQKALGMTPNNPIGARISTLLAEPVTKGGIYDVQQRESPTGRAAQQLAKYGFYYPLAAGEAALELIASRFPTGGYNVTYDAVGRMASWYVDVLASHALRTFRTYEKLGQLGKFNFENLTDPRNSLAPWEVLPSFWEKFGIHDQSKIPGWARPNSTNLQLARELFYLNTPRDLQDLIITYWRRLADTPDAQRGDVEFLAPEERDPEQATQKANARFRGIASRFVEQTHHATPLNRPYQLQKNTGFVAVLPFAGWTSQTIKQFATYWGKVAAPFGREGAKFDSHTGLLAAGLVSAMAFTLFSFLGGDVESRFLRFWDRLVNKKNTQLKTIDEAEGPAEAAEIAIHNVTAVIPLANSTFNSMLGATGYRGTYGFQAFSLDKLNALLNYARGVVRTHDITYGLDRLAIAQIPFTEPIIENLFNREGFQTSRNTVRALQKHGPQELVERRASAGISLPSELTPYRMALQEAVFSGRPENVTKAAQDFVAKAAELGRAEPEKVLAQVFSTLNPYRQAFGGLLTDQQRTETLAKMADYERGQVDKAESTYSAAADQLGLSSNFTKEDSATARSGSNSRPAEASTASRGTPLSAFGGRRLSLGRSSTAGIAATGLGPTQALSRGRGVYPTRRALGQNRRIRLFRGRLSPRSGRITRVIRISRPRRRRLTYA